MTGRVYAKGHLGDRQQIVEPAYWKGRIIGALNALILNRLVTRVNSGQGKNVPVSIIMDELPQLEADYGKVGKDKIITTVGNVISGSTRSKDTLDWLFGDIFGKVVQLKK